MSSGLPQPPPGFVGGGRSNLPPPPPGSFGLPPPPHGGGHGGLPPPPAGLRGLPPPPQGFSGLPPPPGQHRSEYGAYPPQQSGGHQYPQRPPGSYPNPSGSYPNPSGSTGLPPPPPGIARMPPQPYPRQNEGPPAPRDYPRPQQEYSRPDERYAQQDDRYGRGPPQPVNNNYGSNSYPSQQQQFNQRPPYQQQQQQFGGHGGQYPQAQMQQQQQGGQGYPPRVYDLRDPTNTVWVGNLDPMHTDDVLRQAFAPFGKVMRIARVEGKNFLFVHFRFKEEAQNAVSVLTAQGSLGRVKFNYGKQFDYSPEELSAPYDPSQPWQHQDHSSSHRGGGDRYGGDRYGGNNDRYGGGAGGDRYGDRRDSELRPKRNRDEEVSPSNVLWIGNLPHSLSDSELRQNFESFGRINSISRLQDRNMAFVHFETVEQCQHALDVMRGQPICGVMLTLNYGRAQRQNESMGSHGAGQAADIANETVTNVVYLGNLATNVTHDDVDRMFDEFPGFINAKYISSKGIAFGHFDSLESAKNCRVALQGRLMGGAPFRVSFGKDNHTMTMMDKKPAPGQFSNGNPLDPTNVDPFNALAFLNSTTNNGALVTMPSSGNSGNPFSDFGSGGDSGALVIPAMGSGGALSVTVGAAASGAAKFFTRERPPPTITIETRLAALNAATYNSCGEAEKILRPSVVQSLCDAVDACVDAETGKALDTAMSFFSPLNGGHLFALCAKRLKDFYNTDPHKKLLVLYACTRLLLGTKTNTMTFSRISLWSYLVLLAVASENQDAAGLDQLRMITDKLKTGHDFYLANKLDDVFISQFTEQLDVVMERARADQELAQFAKRRRK